MIFFGQRTNATVVINCEILMCFGHSKYAILVNMTANVLVLKLIWGVNLFITINARLQKNIVCFVTGFFFGRWKKCSFLLSVVIRAVFLCLLAHCDACDAFNVWPSILSSNRSVGHLLELNVIVNDFVWIFWMSASKLEIYARLPMIAPKKWYTQ